MNYHWWTCSTCMTFMLCSVSRELHFTFTFVANWSTAYNQNTPELRQLLTSLSDLVSHAIILYPSFLWPKLLKPCKPSTPSDDYFYSSSPLHTMILTLKTLVTCCKISPSMNHLVCTCDFMYSEISVNVFMPCQIDSWLRNSSVSYLYVGQAHCVAVRWDTGITTATK